MDIQAMVNGEEMTIRLSVHAVGPDSLEIYGDNADDPEGNTPFVLTLNAVDFAAFKEMFLTAVGVGK